MFQYISQMGELFHSPRYDYYEPETLKLAYNFQIRIQELGYYIATRNAQMYWQRFHELFILSRDT